MRILLVGNGGREHALLWKLQKDAPQAHFLATQPNGGMAPWTDAIPHAADDVEGIVSWVRKHPVDLVVIGPEAPLAAGLADRLGEAGVPAFGPRAGAARIESSKAFAKELMEQAGVPTAAYRTFTSALAAEAHLRRMGAPVVVKASGLAAGKGAVVCSSVDQAVSAARDMLEGNRFGAAGQEVVVEEFMNGEELSLFAITDGRHVLPMVASQDHKRLGEEDTGPNTGGMGAYAPVSLATPERLEEVVERILHPTLAALAARGSPFRGLLYAGLMLTPHGPRVVEFNCRFGDPETQVVLPLMASSLLEPMLTVARGDSLEGGVLEWTEMAAVTTVLASEGYPGAYRKGLAIQIPPELESRDDLLLFHAGTREEEGELRTTGGRVLACTGVAPTLADAAAISRDGAETVSFQGKYFRNDIGWREMARDEANRP
ncbi:MAG: phosphoribosylamine--glycine ligase [Gemmatimonadota bacterium]